MTIRELADEAPIEGRLSRAVASVAERDGAEKVRALLVAAELFALIGDRTKSDEASKAARGKADGALLVDVELTCAHVTLRFGDAVRCLTALERAESMGGAKEPQDRALFAVLHGLADGVQGRLLAARERVALVLAELRRASELALDPQVLAFAELAAAELALLDGDQEMAAQALAAVSVADPMGLLRAQYKVLRARHQLALPDPEFRLARGALSEAVWSLVKIGAVRELGLSYLYMGLVEASDPDSATPPADWLARAHPLLHKAGSVRDAEDLLRAFRAHGRRALDRLVDSDLGTRIDAVRANREQLRDAIHARLDGAQRVSSSVESALVTALKASRVAEEDLIGALEGVLVDRDRMGQLLAVSQKLVRLEESADAFGAVPRLVLQLTGVDASELIERDADGRLTVIARRGAPLTASRARLEQEVHEVLDARVGRLFERSDRSGARKSQPPTNAPRATRVAVVPLSFGVREAAVVAARTESGGALADRDLESLTVFANLAASALERSLSAEALREVAARDAAVIDAIRDGVMMIGRDSVVQTVNRAAERLLGEKRDTIVGSALAHHKNLRALHDGLNRGRALDGEVISTPRGDLLVRSRDYEGGTVATFQAMASVQKIAQRIVGQSARFSFGDLMGADPKFLDALEDARRAAASDVPILITGESGTGKELVAQAIHNASPRANEPFVGINVAAIPRELLESELFGYERGAFTGARSGGKAGKFEMAEHGTILLDEIGEMPTEMQAKLLRVLQERAVQRLGGTSDKPIHARVVATTHRDLEQAVEEGSFRLDLFFRLRVVHLRLPPLRERRGDVPTLVKHYLARYAERASRPTIQVSDAVMRELEAYDWPGNVRELANMIEGEASLLAEDVHLIDRVPRHLKRAQEQRSATEIPAPVRLTQGATEPVLPLEDVERKVFAHALRVHDGNVAAAARALGVARGTLYNKIKRYGLPTA